MRVVIEASQGIVGVVGFLCVVLPAGYYEAPPIGEYEIVIAFR